MKEELLLEKLNKLENILKKNDDKPLCFKEAAAYLGFRPSYLYKLTHKKLISFYKPSGKMLFFSKSELDEWIFCKSKVPPRGVAKSDGSSVEIPKSENEEEDDEADNHFE
ncbi:MAG: helix-turn-helix domain-containing protein [Ignavibacteriaceae bacterium]|jgi:excisionase family DNA binding protein